MVVVPTDASRAYVVEAREPVGRDGALCDNGVLVYTVDATVWSGSGPIRVKDGGAATDPAAARCGTHANGALDLGPGEVSTLHDGPVTVEVLVWSPRAIGFALPAGSASAGFGGFGFGLGLGFEQRARNAQCGLALAVCRDAREPLGTCEAASSSSASRPVSFRASWIGTIRKSDGSRSRAMWCHRQRGPITRPPRGKGLPTRLTEFCLELMVRGIEDRGR